MPSVDHEMPLELFRNQPALAPELLQSVFGLKIPADTRVCMGSETFMLPLRRLLSRVRQAAGVTSRWGAGRVFGVADGDVAA